MALTITQFISRGQNGQPIALVSTTTPGLSTISPNTSNAVNVNGIRVEIGTSSAFDLGQYFTAQHVLESYDIRAGIISGQLFATIGYVSLSLTPVV